MQIKSAPSAQDLVVVAALVAALLLALALSARIVPLRGPALPLLDAPAQSVAPAPAVAPPAPRPGRMFDDMPVDPPVHEPGTGTPRYAGE